MTKKEIKDLIIASDYKNKDVVIWLKWSPVYEYDYDYDYDFADEIRLIYYCHYHKKFIASNFAKNLNEMVDFVHLIQSREYAKNFKLKILEVDDV